MKPGNRHGNVKWCQITQSEIALADERKCADRRRIGCVTCLPVSRQVFLLQR